MILKAVRNKTLAGPFLYCIQDEQGRTVAGANSPELARLIEAAPALLAVCRLALQYLQHPEVQALPFVFRAECAANRVQAAIAQATRGGD